MQKSQVIIGTYNSVPEGAEESLYEETYQVCWRPFLSSLYRFPEIYAALHYTGSVLRWLEARHPEFLMLLEEMTARKQIELLGGGFFAPLFPLVPGADRLGQIELLTTYIRKAFGKRPRGSWIQEYAWEPGLVSSLQTCGFDYTFLPERHFRLAGATLGLPAVTEDQGRSLTVFPVFDAMESFERPLAPFEACAALRERIGALPLYTMFYPDRASRRLWEDSGLESPDVFFERAFAALRREAENIETTTPGRFLKSGKRSGRAYFPSQASAFLMQRSLPEGGSPCAHERMPLFGEGRDAGCESAYLAGNPRRLLLRHEESMALYAKMHYVRILVGQLRGDKSRKKTAQEELWRGQCGEAYWYGPSGGLLRLPVRAAAYAALIEAEKTTRQRGSFSPGLILADIDFDGEKELLYQGGDYNAYVHLRGGHLFELDSMRTKTNYVNVLSDLPQADGKPRSRRCFHDRVFPVGTFGKEAGSFHEATYEVDASAPSAHLAVLSREGYAALAGIDRLLGLRKSFAFKKGAMTVEYEITNRENLPLAFRFAVEFNLAAGLEPAQVALEAAPAAEDAAPIRFDASHEVAYPGVKALCIENCVAEERIAIRSERPFHVSHSPVWRHGEADGLAREFYEGASFLLGWDLELDPESATRIPLVLDLRA